MTLIAGYMINACPVLLGDVLLSNPKGVGESVSTPSWHTADEAPTLQIVNMVQKVNVVHDHACFAWAGSYIQAKVFAKELQAYLEADDLDDEKMLAFLCSFDKADYSDLACIIYTVHDGYLKRFHLRAPDYVYDGLMVQTAGSGQEHFLNAIPHFFHAPSEMDRSERAVVAPGLSYIASAFGGQIMTGSGIDNGWGGAFELAYFANGKFQKIDDVLYVFWTADQNENGSFVLQSYPCLVKTNYFGDTFTVMVGDYGDGLSQTRIYNICPVGMSDDVKHTPSLSFSYLINYILIRMRDGTSNSCTMLKTKTSADGINVKRTDDAIQIDFSADFMREILETALGPGSFATK